MLFNFPYSYSYQDGAIVGNIIRGSLLLWASLIGVAVTFFNWSTDDLSCKVPLAPHRRLFVAERRL